jgi:disulfide bond formation protein DsbB
MRRPQFAFACFIVGLLLVFLIEANIARIIGVPLMLLGIGLGIPAIATPEFLEGDRQN